MTRASAQKTTELKSDINLKWKIMQRPVELTDKSKTREFHIRYYATCEHICASTS